MAILIWSIAFGSWDFNVSVDEWFHHFMHEILCTVGMYIDQSTNGNPVVAQAKAGASTLFAAALHDLCFTSPACVLHDATRTEFLVPSTFAGPFQPHASEMLMIHR